MANPYIHMNNSDRDIWSRSVGQALTILLNSERKSISIASVGVFVLPFARLNQIKIFYGYNDFPAAYLTWGYLTHDIIGLLLEDADRVLDIEELNAGDNLVIFDMISNLRSVAPMIDYIRLLAHGNHHSVYGMRYDRTYGRVRLKKYGPNKRLQPILSEVK